MATYPIHYQVAAVEAAAKANPSDGALAAAAVTLREIVTVHTPSASAYVVCPACGTGWEDDDWRHDRLTRAMEGLMP